MLLYNMEYILFNIRKQIYRVIYRVIPVTR